MSVEIITKAYDSVNKSMLGTPSLSSLETTRITVSSLKNEFTKDKVIDIVQSSSLKFVAITNLIFPKVSFVKSVDSIDGGYRKYGKSKSFYPHTIRQK